MLEKDIEKLLVKEVKKVGGRAYKFVSPGNDGVPDRIVIFPGRVPVFAELKTEKGIVRPLQRVQLNTLESLGQEVMVVRGLVGLQQLFEKYGYPDVARSIRRRYEE